MKWTAMVVVMTTILAVGADKPATETGPVAITILNGRMIAKGKSFQGVADRVEWDAAKTTVILEGLDGKPATIRRAIAVDGRFDIVEAKKIIFNYGNDAISAEGAYSAGGR